MKLSVIIPFISEYPQVLFTIQSVAQNILCDPGIDFEILAVDNYCEEARDQAVKSAEKVMGKLEDFFYKKPGLKEMNDALLPHNKELTPFNLWKVKEAIYPTYENRSGASVEACAKGHMWLRYLKCEDRLSHWEAKRVACKEATGDVFLFLDSHVVPYAWSIPRMFRTYTGQHNINPSDPDYEFLVPEEYFRMGSMHLPLTYKILEWRRLIYKMHIENEHFYSYKFTPFRPAELPYEVPVMSTCGMMLSRDIYEKIGGWPEGMTMYGGGENYMNYTLAVCGYKKWIFPEGLLSHHGDNRDYHYTGDGLIWNRLVAHYLFGGRKGLLGFASVSKGNTDVIQNWCYDILTKYSDHREKIKDNQKIDLTEWARSWTE